MHRVAADLLAFYFLYPDQPGAEAKLAGVTEVISWALSDSAPDLGNLTEAYAFPIGSAGTYYSIHRDRQIEFYSTFAREVLRQSVDTNERESCQMLADSVASQIKGSAGARNVLLHLLFPAYFDRVVSQSDRVKIARAFADRDGGVSDLDEQIHNIRLSLGKELGRADFGFHDEDARAIWDPNGANKSGFLARSQERPDDVVTTPEGYMRIRDAVEAFGRETGIKL